MKNKIAQLDLLIVAIVALLFSFGSFVFLRNSILEDLEKARSEYLDKIASEFDELNTELEKRVLSKVYLAKSLTSYVSYNPEIDEAAFQDFASKVYQFSDSDLQAIQLVRDSIIIFNYPDAGNEVSLGKNIIKLGEDSDYVRKNIRSKSAMLIGPRMLLQDKLGMVYRDPIILGDEDRLWGYSVMVMDLKQMLGSLGSRVDWDYAIYSPTAGIDEDGYFFGSKTDIEKASLSEEITILDDQWKLYAFADLSAFYDSQFFKSEGAITAFSLLIAGILGFSIGIFLYSLFSLQAQNNLLKNQKSIIEEQLEEKSTLIKEVHHRIKNHFQLMNSLNNILYTDSEDQKVQEVVAEINSRVQSLSEVYNQLTEEDGRQLNTQKYLESLTSNIIRGTTRKVDFEIEVAPQQMEVKKTAYLGVILNEMITNSLKYAFEPTDTAKIKISLQANNGDYQLNYWDNGGRLTQKIFEEKRESKGLDLLKTFAQQLGGILRYDSSQEWVGYKLKFPKV